MDLLVAFASKKRERERGGGKEEREKDIEEE